VLTITQVNYIRELYFLEGKTYSEINKMTGKNYRTIKKYVEMDDFNENHISQKAEQV
jgi:U3 small nucleolar RNA-associated protein 14